MVARKPTSIRHVDAASMPVVAVTAWQMLFDYANVTSGQTVLVHGAGGAVGAYAVRLAKQSGARVIGTEIPRGLEDARRSGADTVVDVTTSRFEDVAEGVDAVIDTVGGELQGRSFAVVRPNGVLVSSVSQPDAREGEPRGIRSMFTLVQVTTSRLVRIAERVDAGQLPPRLGAILTLSEAVQAHEMLEGMRPRPNGKIVLRVAE
jgi:NADPH:quinone reductase-like Zn-dependent oxidoreductase